MELQMINKRLKIISELQDELNKAKTVLDETLEDNPEYQKFQEDQLKVKEETKTKKDKIMASQTVKGLEDQVKQLRDDIKENKEVLAMELADYYKDQGVLEIVDDEGNIKRIVFSVKLVNK